MRRDLDLAKEILEQLEARATPNGWAEVRVDGRSDLEIAYHIKLLAQAGLVEAHDVSSMAEMDWRASSLTWRGHEFLDATKNRAVWQRFKEVIREKGGDIPFDVAKTLLQQIAQQVFLS